MRRVLGHELVINKLRAIRLGRVEEHGSVRDASVQWEGVRPGVVGGHGRFAIVVDRVRSLLAAQTVDLVLEHLGLVLLLLENLLQFEELLLAVVLLATFEVGGGKMCQDVEGVARVMHSGCQ